MSTKNKTSFQKGHTCLHKKVKVKATSPSSDKKCPPRDIRTRSQTLESSRETYFIGHLGKMEDMFNQAYYQHKHTACDQPHFNMKKICQRVISVTMQLTCTNCKFTGSPANLYREVHRNGPGRKASTLNKALGVALLHSPVGPTQFQEIFLRIGIDSGSVTSLQRLINESGECVDTLAQKNMSDERSKIKSRGPISIACDTRYNSAIGSGNTPFQAGTQAVFAVTEQETPQKKILHVGTFSKLCPRGTMLRKKDKGISCPNHEGGCTANLQPSASIGLEGNYAAHSAKILKKDGIEIRDVTSDGDSNIHKGIADTFGDNSIERLTDSFHSARNVKGAIKRTDFSKQMFPGTKRRRDSLKSLFAEIVRKRCLAELSAAKKKITGKNKKSSQDLKKELTETLKKTPSAIIECLKGNHKLCKYSLTCSHLRNKKNADSPGKKMSMTKEDEKSLMNHILKLLGPNAIAHNYRNTSTQKNEAINRAFCKTNPKNATSTRNFKAKIGAAVLMTNLDLQASVELTQRACELEISASLQKRIKRVSSQRTAKKSQQKKIHVKQRRVESTTEKYDIYEKLRIGEKDPGYQKGRFGESN